jgi:hypothetical protein
LFPVEDAGGDGNRRVHIGRMWIYTATYGCWYRAHANSKMLVEMGGSILAQDVGGGTPLHMAIV